MTDSIKFWIVGIVVALVGVAGCSDSNEAAQVRDGANEPTLVELGGFVQKHGPQLEALATRFAAVEPIWSLQVDDSGVSTIPDGHATDENVQPFIAEIKGLGVSRINREKRFAKHNLAGGTYFTVYARGLLGNGVVIGVAKLTDSDEIDLGTPKDNRPTGGTWITYRHLEGDWYAWALP